MLEIIGVKLKQLERCFWNHLFRPLVLLIGLFFNLSAFANTSDPFVGVYHAKTDTLAYLIIKQSDGRYFGNTAYGSMELVINDNGKLRSKGSNYEVTGEFSQPLDGVYQRVAVNVADLDLTYQRVEVSNEDLIALMYGAEQHSSDFSSAMVCSERTEVPSDVEYKAEYLDDLISNIEVGRMNYKNTNSLLVMKDGQLLVEEYFNGWTADEPHQVQSVSKSLTSLLAGMAITEEKIPGSDAPVSTLLPRYKTLFEGAKANITLQQFLTMSAGLEWNEWSSSYDNPDNVRVKEMESADSVAFTLKRPLVNEPGSTFSYSGGFVSVVGEVIREATEQATVSDYAKNGPLSALCLKNAFWFKQQDGRTNVAGGAYMRPIDMLKIGQLVLNDGAWNGQQIIDKDWMIESTTPVIDSSLPGKRYGYFWWETEFSIQGETYSAIMAQGWGGQDIVIIKSLNLVVVKTAESFNSQSPIGTMMILHILPALVS
ncbi:serine hydrolase [Thaumasiovibrio subtropicus]|uniref:serine hydrolase n=1 Tax=Thaumasiovibrio subtropicus TaxID=1891207 RepID=UPI000B35FCA2|nr:serine hydrolase [Thaumasiovibrio subtropicus]